MYFYEEGECITNTESALSKPNSFTREENEKVVYFQNGCLTKIQKQSIVLNTFFMTADRFCSSIRYLENTFEPVLMESSSSTDSPADDIGEDVSEEYENEEGGNPEITQKSGGLAINDAEIGVKEVGGDEDYGTDKTPSDAVRFLSCFAYVFITYSKSELELLSNLKVLRQYPLSRNSIKKGEKASYIKYKKNPKNFESTTTIFTNEGEQSETAMKHEAHFDIAQDHPSSIIGSSVEEEIFTDTDKGDQLVQGQTSSFGEKHVNHETILETDEKAQNEDFPTYFSEWSEWTICKKAGERQIRRRKCLNLRRCIGALMQVRNCPAIVPEPAQSGPVQSIRSVVEVTRFPEYDDTKSDQSALETSSTISSETMWSPWFGVCQHFASAQPCNNGEMIGFESRECIAKEPNLCEGPFFRYCTLSC
ncbi:hypothetical protein DICVIV_11663 [Dictyocaulus viviparus]|uniref:Uncharacterized protein n=1 Tax=Dictyocaulus viviparus TaxID=29172 RepID=A0A0D8XF30_DICVI|nr:hypothetical protein DICVIV_11663 [Dictyocaulus viviparus]